MKPTSQRKRNRSRSRIERRQNKRVDISSTHDDVITLPEQILVAPNPVAATHFYGKGLAPTQMSTSTTRVYLAAHASSHAHLHLAPWSEKEASQHCLDKQPKSKAIGHSHGAHQIIVSYHFRERYSSYASC
jgi:hypothetical protein